MTQLKFLCGDRLRRNVTTPPYSSVQQTKEEYHHHYSSVQQINTHENNAAKRRKLDTNPLLTRLVGQTTSMVVILNVSKETPCPAVDY